MTTEVHADNQLDHMMSTLWLSRAVQSAVKLGLPEAIAEGDRGTSCDTLASKFDWQVDALYRLLRALSANGIFAELPGQCFAHTEPSRQLRADHPRSRRHMMMLDQSGPCLRAWEALPASVENGIGPFEQANGVPLFNYLAEHRELSDIFNRAMVQFTAPLMHLLLDAYPELRDTPTVCDLGGGLGQLLAGLLQAAPAMRGAVYDLPGLKYAALDYLATAGVGKRADYLAGSFRETVPEGYQTYIIKNCLWNWGDADASRILGNVAASLDAGTLLIVEPLITPETAPYSTLMDLQMLVMPNGRSRTQRQYEGLLQRAGMRLKRTLRVGLEHSVLECVRT